MKHARKPDSPSFSAKLILFATLAAAWLAFDRVTKTCADAASPGDVLVDNLAGLFELRLVHNTGAAWGILPNATFALGIFSIVVCALLLILLFTYCRSGGGMVQVAALALVFAGGLGNAIDRLTVGHVIDFIHATFVDFPVFNVADIGVTCGIVVFALTVARRERSAATPVEG